CGCARAGRPRPEGTRPARPADDRVSPVDAHLVTGLRIRNAAYIGDTPHAKRLCPALSLRHLERVLIRRQCKKFAHTAAAGATIRAVVPYPFAGDRSAGGLQIGPATGQ